MMKHGATLIALCLGAIGLDCERREAPVSYHGEAPPAEDAGPAEHAEGGAAPADDTVRLSPESRELVGIEAAEVTLRECRCTLKAMGKVLAPKPQTAIVSHAFPGRVGQVHVKLGDWVEKDQPLVTLESNEVGEAKADFYKARADLELAQLNLEREKRLSESGIGIKKNLLASEREQKIAETSAETAHKKLHVLGFTDEQVDQIATTHQVSPAITLDAPIQGKVVAIEAVLGAFVDPTTELLTIIDPTRLWVDAEIYEKDLAKVKVGQGVKIAVPAHPDALFDGRISYIGDVVSDETHTITVRAEVDNEDGRLKPGMFADVCVLLNGAEQALAVPTAAVLEEADRKIVFVERDGDFVCREVKTGVVNGDYQQIVSGLAAAERVVILGNHELKSKLKQEVLAAAHVH